MKKFLSLLLTAIMLLSLVACGQDTGRTPVSTQTPAPTSTAASTQDPSGTGETAPAQTVPTESTESTEPTQTTEPSAPEGWRSTYAVLLEDFRKIIAFRMDPDFKSDWEQGIRLPDVSETLLNISFENAYRWDTMILELSGGDQTEADFGYILHDINGDGIPELFWVHKDHTVCAIFTCHQDAPVLLDAYWSRYNCYVNQNIVLYGHGSNGAQDNQVQILVLKDTLLKEVFLFGTETVANGNVQYYEATEATTMVSEKERVDSLYAAFPRQHSAFWLSLPVVPLTQAPTDYRAAASQGLPYTTMINRKDFPIWSGPGYDYQFTDTVRVATKYTIVAEVTDSEGKLWGLLKSGIGWVDLTLLQQETLQPPVITLSPANEEQTADKNNHHYKSDTAGTVFAVSVHETVTDMTFCPVYYQEDLIYEPTLFHLDSWSPDKVFVADVPFPGDMSMYAIRFTRQDGSTHTYLIGISGRNGALYLTPAPAGSAS